MNLEEAKADCEEELQIVESILEARRNKGGVSGDLMFVRTYIGLLEKRSLIDPEPEKECPNCSDLEYCREHIPVRTPARKTEGLTREEALAAYDKGARIWHPLSIGLFSRNGIFHSSYFDKFIATYPEAPKPEPIELGFDVEMQIQKLETIEERKFCRDFSRLLISRILELVGERR